MSRSAKSISIRNLHGAVKEALETTKANHPVAEEIVIIIIDGGGIVFHPPIYCGLPPREYFDTDVKKLEAFNNEFVKRLEANPALAALTVEGKLQPTVVISEGKASLGFVPGAANITE
jgi:hypothetical protein